MPVTSYTCNIINLFKQKSFQKRDFKDFHSFIPYFITKQIGIYKNSCNIQTDKQTDMTFKQDVGSLVLNLSSPSYNIELIKTTTNIFK